MNKNKNHKPMTEDEDYDFFDDEFSVASAMECTGLIPSAPADEDEERALRELYGFGKNQR